jgi:DNA-binding NtrC family response regulator
MASLPSPLTSLAELFDQSDRPIYAVDARRQIVYGNTALAQWLGLEGGQIAGRYVEYHSESDAEQAGATTPGSSGPLAGLCPPPRALAGEQCVGTVSQVARGGRLVHRHADFLPLATAGSTQRGVLAVLATHDLSPEELATDLSSEPTGDELHRAIRQFRRTQARQFAVESLVGESSAMRKVRDQVAAAAASGANVLVCGPPGSGRAHVARAIHYRAAGEAGPKLVPVDCEVLSEDLLRRTLDAVQSDGGGKQRATLLLANLDRLSPSLQSQLQQAIGDKRLAARIVATATEPDDETKSSDEATSSSRGLEARLLDTVSTITIHVPPLADRLEDLPLLAQCFVEAQNRGNPKQIGGVRPEALDLLALHRWPGELDELRDVIAAAHAACSGHEIAAADLPAVAHHAARAAALPRRETERIVLDEFLASIEKELIERAMAQAGGNKTEAAQLLGLTRPRLYRRLVQLGLVAETLSSSPFEEEPKEQ